MLPSLQNSAKGQGAWLNYTIESNVDEYESNVSLWLFVIMEWEAYEQISVQIKFRLTDFSNNPFLIQ